MPYLSYCSEIRDKTNIPYINSLYLLQKKMVRTMSKVGRLDHTNALLQVDLKLLKLSYLIDLKIAIISVQHRPRYRVNYALGGQMSPFFPW